MKTLIMKSPSKSCSLDLMPTWLLKLYVSELLPIITAIVNVSMDSWRVPPVFKCAQIRPLLKKPTLDPDILKNYRPVSNLPFISKVLEKVVDTRIECHLVENGLHEELQSAYHRFHLTETALLKVQSDILESLDNGFVTVLVMLDMSAAFDTLNHRILLSHFENVFGISGAALNCFQVVVIDSEHSKPVLLKYGVPQGSVLDPKKYTMYAKPLEAIIRKHGLSYHFYADDTQLYISFKPKGDAVKAQSLLLIENCLTDIEGWMRINMLKLNSDKTEVILFTSKHNAIHMKNVTVCFGDINITPVNTVRNLGVIFECAVNMEQQFNNICRAGYHQLRNNGHIRHYLTSDASKSLVNGLITSHLNYFAQWTAPDLH